MRTNQLILRGTFYAWRSYLAVGLSVLVGTAALTGALLVGDSMRGSLRDQALARLGPVDFALRAPLFVRDDVVEAMAKDAALHDDVHGIAGVVEMKAGIEQAEKKTRANDISLFGVDGSIRNVFSDAGAIGEIGSNSVVINRALAVAIGAKQGDDVLLRVTQSGPIPAESMLGRPEALTVSLRLTVSRVIGNDGIGGFSLDVSQWTPRNAFVSLARLQKAIDSAGRVNAVLVSATDAGRASPDATVAALEKSLGTHLGLADDALHLRKDDAVHAIALESDRLLIGPTEAAAARGAASGLKATASGVLAQLANSIDALNDNGQVIEGRRIPYSIVCGTDVEKQAAISGGSLRVAALGEDDVVLNEWAAKDLGVRVGDSVSMEYYVPGRFATLNTERHTFHVAAIVPIESWAADRGLMPTYPGIADANSVADWDPPPSFKIDLSRIREKDEAYWLAYRGTPKAFVSLATGQKLWAGTDARFGDLTAIYFGVPKGESADAFEASLRKAILERLGPAKMGLVFSAVKQRAVKAGSGSTDFSGLFIAFSFFVILAAAILVALSFRLATERRAGQVGLLMAVGFGRGAIRHVFLSEGGIVAGIGAIVGLPAGAGYAWLMLAGLKTWWAGAVNAPFLTLHVTSMSLGVGFVGGFLMALLSIWLALRGLMRMSPRMLLAGALGDDASKRAGRRRWAVVVLVLSVVVGLGSTAAAMVSDSVPKVAAFFGAGGGLLVAGLAAMAMWLGRSGGGAVITAGPAAMLRLGMRNARRERRRSVLTASLIACATFVVVAVGANRHRAGEDAFAKDGGTGGYRLMATASTPLPFDMNTREGRERLGISEKTASRLDHATVMALRLKHGDDSSCLNLYQVTQPEILGVPRAWIARGGFAFAQSAASTDAEREDPWRLLENRYDDGAVPAIGDMNTLMWLLKLGIGDDLPIVDERGNTVKLRIVGMLSGSILQSQLVVAEDRFVEMYPSTSGYGMVLIGAKGKGRSLSDAQWSTLSAGLERDLSSYGFDAEPSLDVLNRYQAIENTYMSAFQALGGLGLAIGTIGLAAVMLRNVFERRRELALLRALGYSPGMLGWMVFAENAALLAFGLVIGTVSALIAAWPNIASTGATVSWGSLVATLIVVAVVGLASGALAVRAAVRAPLISALRDE